MNTPERVYALSCHTVEARDKWIDAIDAVSEKNI